MKHVLVVGLGSMGKRRIRLLLERPDVIVCGVDGRIERCREVEDKFLIHTYSTIEDALCHEQCSCAFVCTSPLSHADIIHQCLECNLHVFTEINLVDDGYEANINLAQKKNKILFLSSTLLYRKETQYIINIVGQTNCKMNYNYHIGQYLPDWHPWESYNNYFVGSPRTNGCREIMAIELPWLITAFGDILNVHVLKSKNTSLNINYNDNYIILIEHESGIKGVFSVDVVSRKAICSFELYGENIYLTWNGTPDSLMQYDIESQKDTFIKFCESSEHIDGYAEFVTENPYREEINSYFDTIDGMNKEKWNLKRDKKMLTIIDRIEA